MKVSVYIATTLDGFIARENGSLDWLPGSDGESSNENEDLGYHAFMDSVDVLVMGRHTYETVSSFEQWPYGHKRVVILCNKPVKIPENLSKTVKSTSCSPTKLVKSLSESGAKHLYIDGGKTIQSFINADLIQEITITRIPILIGSGIPLFGALNNDKQLRHIETHTFDKGFVQSKYEVII